MSGLNLDALKKVQEGLNSGDKKLLYANKLTGETDIRIMPPLPSLNGLFFLEQEVWWINDKPYVSNSTLGGEDVIQTELDAAAEWQKETKDAQLLKLLNDKDRLSKKSRFHIPVLQLACEFGAGVDKAPTKTEVVDGCIKVLVCGAQLIKELNAIATSRIYQNGTPDGITDMVRGRNAIVSKTGQKLNTEYKALAWNFETDMSKDFGKYYAAPLDIVEDTRKHMQSDDYLIGVIRNYLYGEAMPVEEKRTEAPAAAQSSAPPPRRGAAAPQAAEATPTPPAAATSAPPRRGAAAAKADDKTPTPPAAATSAPPRRGAAAAKADDKTPPPPARRGKGANLGDALKDAE